MMYRVNKILFHLFGKRSQRKEFQERSAYLSSEKFLEDMRQAVEKGAEEQTRIMHKAGMKWSNES